MSNNILIATSEAVPFAKTGGLADVCGALPGALSQWGQQPTLMMPAYRCVFEAGVNLTDCGVSIDVPVGNKVIQGRYLQGKLPGSDAPVYFVDQPEFFDRPGLYGEGGVDYRDNCERFTFFSRAILESIRLLDLQTDVVHCNDWQTSLIPALIHAEYRFANGYQSIASLLTVHNLAYQGQFWHWDMLLTGLDWKYFNWKELEFYGDLNLLKGGLVFADAITTVSPKYAEQIQEPELGCGLHEVIRQRAADLTGILNGVNYDQWNPATDQALDTNYGPDDWKSGKAACKAALQREMGLPEHDAPLIGLVGRLVEQKGVDLVIDIMERWSQTRDVQWAILGTGHPELENALSAISRSAPHRAAVRVDFDGKLARRIEAGADMFLMPSRFEPCGLNQLYSLKYGTVPIVHATGGLANTVTDYTPEHLAGGIATGFVFHHPSKEELESALERAVATYCNRPDVWEQLVETGMRQDWSWQRSAQEYVRLYEKISTEAKQAVCA